MVILKIPKFTLSPKIISTLDVIYEVNTNIFHEEKLKDKFKAKIS